MNFRFRIISMLCVTTTGAVAAPRLSVTADGECPDREALVSAVAAKGFSVVHASESANYSLQVQTRRASASLRLLDASGTSVVERRFDSLDCRAMADAMAVVVEAYFVDLGPLPDRAQPGALAPANDAPKPPALVPANDAPKPPALVPANDAPKPPALVPANDAPKPPALAPVNTPKLAAREKPSDATPRTQSNHQLAAQPNLYPRGTLGAGLLLALPVAAGTTTAFDVGVGVDFAKLPLSLDLMLTTTLPVTTGDAPDRVRRWSNQGLLRASTPIHAQVLLRPWAALGMVLVRLRELDLPPTPPIKTTRSLVAGAGMELGLPVLGAWSGRLDLGCVVLMERDEYRVQSQRIGTGPLATCTATVGVWVGGRPNER